MTAEEKKDVVSRLFAYLKEKVPNFRDMTYEIVRNETSGGEPVVTSRPASGWKYILKAKKESSPGWTYWPGGETEEDVCDKIIASRRDDYGIFAFHTRENILGGKDPYFPVMERIRKPGSAEELLVVLTAMGF